MNSIEQQKDHFNNIALEYYLARQNPNSLMYKQLLWKHIFSFMPPTQEVISVLEAMCGYAEGEDIVTSYYCPNINYTGFDYSEKLIDIVKQSNPEKNVFVQDVTTFRPSSKYDLILIIGGLHHVPEYSEVVLKNLKEGLADNGCLINFEPTHGNRITKAIRSHIYRSNPIFDSTEKDYSVDELNNIYSGAGFKITHQFYPGLLAYSLYYNPDAFPSLARISPIVLKVLFALEKPFYKTWIARFFSFATLTVLTHEKR